MLSSNSDGANYMQSHKIGDAMFDEDDIFSPPGFDVQICYNDCMPPVMMIIMMKVDSERS